MSYLIGYTMASGYSAVYPLPGDLCGTIFHRVACLISLVILWLRVILQSGCYGVCSVTTFASYSAAIAVVWLLQFSQ